MNSDQEGDEGFIKNVTRLDKKLHQRLSRFEKYRKLDLFAKRHVWHALGLILVGSVIITIFVMKYGWGIFKFNID